MAQMVWPKEIKKYTDRIAALRLMSEELGDELSKFPGLLSFNPTDAGSVRHRTLIFANGNLATSMRLVESIQLLWSNSHFHAAAHCIRLLFELWGSLIYSRERIIRKLEEKDGAKTADTRLTKLTLGTKSKTLLPAGIEGHFPIINVMDFIRAGNDVEPGFEDTYNFLCDVSHPSFVIHTDLFWLTNDGSWGNDLYSKEAHRILEKITATAESSVAGIELQIRSIYQACIPPLVAEIEEHS
jgi:hypothetical protein